MYLETWDANHEFKIEKFVSSSACIFASAPGALLPYEFGNTEHEITVGALPGTNELDAFSIQGDGDPTEQSFVKTILLSAARPSGYQQSTSSPTAPGILRYQ